MATSQLAVLSAEHVEAQPLTYAPLVAGASSPTAPASTASASSAASSLPIKTMKLYTHLERIQLQLRRFGYTDCASKLDVEKLATVDCLHYFGDEPIKAMLMLHGATNDNRNGNIHQQQHRHLDVGAGYGGTSRLLAARGNIQVDAVELQLDLHETAQELTKRCELNDLVNHLHGDFLKMDLPARNHGQYDGISGLLCFMHINDWPRLFEKCAQQLKVNGFLYVEDFFLRNGTDVVTVEEKEILRRDIFVSKLYTMSEIRAMLETAGLEIVCLSDMTTTWQDHIQTRAQSFHDNLQDHALFNGEEAARALDDFYTSVAKIFGVNVGGFTMVARKRA